MRVSKLYVFAICVASVRVSTRGVRKIKTNKVKHTNRKIKINVRN